MGPHLPVTSGARLIAVLGTFGREPVRQHVSHVRLEHPERPVAPVIPLHKELKRGTLAAILRDAGLSADDLDQAR